LIKDGITKKENIRSFLMIGQSNMAGRGEFDEVPPIKNDKCYMLRMGRWQEMSEPVNPDRAVFGMQYHSGVSLAASFADEFSKYTNLEVRFPLKKELLEAIIKHDPVQKQEEEEDFSPSCH